MPAAVRWLLLVPQPGDALANGLGVLGFRFDLEITLEKLGCGFLVAEPLHDSRLVKEHQVQSLLAEVPRSVEALGCFLQMSLCLLGVGHPERYFKKSQSVIEYRQNIVGVQLSRRRESV